MADRKMADRKIGGAIGRSIFLSAIFLSAIFLSAIFLSAIFLSAIFLSAIFLSYSLFIHCRCYDAEPIDQAVSVRRVLITEGGAAQLDISEPPATAAQRAESRITLILP